MKKSVLVPEVGDDIYIPDSFYVSRDSTFGGLSIVIAVEPGKSLGKTIPFVRVSSIPRRLYNWEFLAPLQEELKEKFGMDRATSKS